VAKVNPLVWIGAAVAAAAAFFAYRLFSPSMAFAAAGDTGSGGGGDASGGSAASGSSGVAMQWNDAIAQAAAAAGIDPALLKSIVATETGFNSDAINPETGFTLNGVTYAQYDRAGQRALVAWIKDGNEPATIGLNPSLGIAQVRVGNAKKLINQLNAWDLFDAATCLEAAAYLIRDDGTTLDTADMYNVGNGTNWARGVRNVPYRTKVQTFYAQFRGDFSNA
jgi:hypothetical protein